MTPRDFHSSSQKVLWLVGGYKVLKSLALLAIAVGALRLLHHDVASVATRLIEALRLDPHGHFLSPLLAQVRLLNDHHLKIISAISFGYAVLESTEGVGLFLEQRWAEFLTIWATAALIPFEIYEIVQHRSLLRVAVVIVNVLAVIYLIRVVRNNRG